MALFYSSVPVRHAQHQDSETEAAKWNSASLHFYYLHLCLFFTVTC